MKQDTSRTNHRVLFLSRGGDISGEQRQLLYLLRGLDRDRYTPIVLSTRGGQFQSELQSLGIRHHVHALAGWRKLKNVLKRYRDTAYVRALAAKERISLVHCSDVWLSEYALQSAKHVGVPCILHVRAPLTREQARKRRCHEATYLVTISKRVQMRLVQTRSLPEDRIVMIHDAVDVEVFKPLDPASARNVLHDQYATHGKALIGLVGRVEEAKDQFSFVQIARDVLAQTKQVAFFIIGEIKDRSYYDRVNRYIQNHNLSAHIHFTGRREDIAQVLAGLDILISLTGGSVRYEAMMCGVTVLCAWSRQPEESYHVRHNETGLLVTARSLDAVSRTLLDIIADTATRKRIAANAAIWAREHLGQALLVRDTQYLYERLLGNPSSDSQAARHA